MPPENRKNPFMTAIHANSHGANGQHHRALATMSLSN